MTIVPEPLQPFVEGVTWTRITVGKSPSDTFRLDRSGHAALYLKIAPMAHGMELLREKRRLDWLQGRLPVPDVVGYETDDQSEYLLLTSLRGRHAATLTAEELNEKTVHVIATGLRAIHAISIDDCPFHMALDSEIRRIKYNVVNGLVDEAAFDSPRLGRSAAELFEELLTKRPADEDLVFTHGDYCLPNVMIDQDEVSGFLDWGRAGVADRYKDIALAIRSLERRAGRDLTSTFSEAYGLSRPNVDKIEYYKLLDEFW